MANLNKISRTLTSWIDVSLGKLIVAVVVKKFFGFCGIKKFITFSEAHDPDPSTKAHKFSSLLSLYSFKVYSVLWLGTADNVQ